MGERSLDSDVEKRLRDALFTTSLPGIEATGKVYPLGAFLLIGAMIDMLAGLMHAPQRDNDRQQGARYVAFIDAFFGQRYIDLEMGERMWKGLRCRPLHNFSAQGILLADSQEDRGLHLRVHESGSVVLHWPDFLRDYRAALNRYWSRLQVDPDLQLKAECRCERHPPLMVTKVVYGGMAFPLSFPLSFGGGGSAYGGPPVGGGGPR